MKAALLVDGGGRKRVVGEGDGVGRIDVDADQELEAAECVFHLFRVGEGDHRIARHDDESANAVRIVGEHVVGEDRGGRAAEDLRVAPDSRR